MEVLKFEHMNGKNTPKGKQISTPTPRPTPQRSSLSQKAPTKPIGAPGSAVARIAARHLETRARTYSGTNGRTSSPVNRGNTRITPKETRSRALVSNVSERRRDPIRQSRRPDSDGSRRYAAIDPPSFRRGKDNKLISVGKPGKRSMFSYADPHTYAARRDALFKHRQIDKAIKAYSAQFKDEPLVFSNHTSPYTISRSGNGGNQKAEMCGVQYLYNHNGAALAGQRLLVYPVSPKSCNTTAIFLGTEEYSLATLKHLELAYVPGCPATTSGSWVAFYVPDPDWLPHQFGLGPNILSEAYESMNFVESQVWAPADFKIALPHPMPRIYTNIDQGDPGETCAGYIVIMCTGATLTNIDFGHFLLRSEWLFENRQFNFPDITTSDFGTISLAAGATFDAGDDDVMVFTTEMTTSSFDFDQVDTGEVFLYCVVCNICTTGFNYYFTGIDDGNSKALEVGNVFWITQWISTAGVRTFTLFADRRAALTMMNSSTSATAVERGCARWAQAYTDTNFVAGFRGYGIML